MMLVLKVDGTLSNSLAAIRDVLPAAERVYMSVKGLPSPVLFASFSV